MRTWGKWGHWTRWRGVGAIIWEFFVWQEITGVTWDTWFDAWGA